VTKKKISKKSKSYIAEISDVLQSLSEDQSEVNREIASGNKKLLAFIQEMHPWAFWYCFSHSVIVALFLDCLGLLEKLVEAVKTGDKKEANMAICRELVSLANDEEFFDDMDSLDKEERAAFLSLFFAMQGNQEGLRRYSQTVSELVRAASKDHEALFKAVSVDRSVVANPFIAKEISLAALRQDESFMNLLAKAITRTKPMRNPRLDDTRFMLEVLNDLEGLDQISNDQIAEYFQNELGIYSSDGKDPEAAIKKLLQRRNQKRGT